MFPLSNYWDEACRLWWPLHPVTQMQNLNESILTLIYYTVVTIWELAVLALARIMCADINSSLFSVREEEHWKHFLLSPRSCICVAMASTPMVIDKVFPEETQGPMPVDAPPSVADDLSTSAWTPRFGDWLQRWWWTLRTQPQSFSRANMWLTSLWDGGWCEAQMEAKDLKQGHGCGPCFEACGKVGIRWCAAREGLPPQKIRGGDVEGGPRQRWYHPWYPMRCPLGG